MSWRDRLSVVTDVEYTLTAIFTSCWGNRDNQYCQSLPVGFFPENRHIIIELNFVSYYVALLLPWVLGEQKFLTLYLVLCGAVCISNVSRTTKRMKPQTWLHEVKETTVGVGFICFCQRNRNCSGKNSQWVQRSTTRFPQFWHRWRETVLKMRQLPFTTIPLLVHTRKISRKNVLK